MPRLLTTREVAEALGVSIWHVHELVAKDVLRPVRLTPTGNLRFREDDLRDLIGKGR